MGLEKKRVCSMSSMNDADIQRRLEQLAGIQPSAEATDRVLGRVRQTLTQPQVRPNARSASLWRIVMKSPFTKLATAAVVTIVAILIVNQTGSKPAFADVVQSFLGTKTASFKMTMAVNDAASQDFDCLYAEPIHMRQTTTDGSTIVISDLEKGRIVSLMPARKQAMVVEMENMPDEDTSQFNMFGEIRKRLEEAQSDEDKSVEFLGEKQIGDVKTIGYSATWPLSRSAVGPIRVRTCP